jgi:hypothetical protein
MALRLIIWTRACRFLAACTGCTIDAIAMHAYDRQVQSTRRMSFEV